MISVPTGKGLITLVHRALLFFAMPAVFCLFLKDNCGLSIMRHAFAEHNNANAAQSPSYHSRASSAEQYRVGVPQSPFAYGSHPFVDTPMFTPRRLPPLYQSYSPGKHLYIGPIATALVSCVLLLSMVPQLRCCASSSHKPDEIDVKFLWPTVEWNFLCAKAYNLLTKQVSKQIAQMPICSQISIVE